MPPAYILLLCHSVQPHRVQQIRKESENIKQTVLGGELYALMDALNCAISAKYIFEPMRKRCISSHVFANLMSLVDVISKCSNAKEPGLTIECQSEIKA